MNTALTPLIKIFFSFSFIFSGNLEQREFPEIARGKVALINAFRIIERSCIHILKIKIKVFGSVCALISVMKYIPIKEYTFLSD